MVQHIKTLPNLPKLVFWFQNSPSGNPVGIGKKFQRLLIFFYKEVAQGEERTWVLSISFIFSFSPLYR
jgi:hypothetical protein